MKPIVEGHWVRLGGSGAGQARRVGRGGKVGWLRFVDKQGRESGTDSGYTHLGPDRPL